MQIRSVQKIKSGYRKINIEANMIRGLPRVSIIGLADRTVKESVYRIKSSLLSQNFKWSVRKNLIISLSPSAVKKNNAQFDLALAASYLKLTKQMTYLNSNKEYIFYGELSLNGDIASSNLSIQGFQPKQNEVWIGNFEDYQRYSDQVIRIKNIRDLKNLNLSKSLESKVEKNDSVIGNYSEKLKYFSKDWLFLFEILCHGEHSSLFCGPEAEGLSDFISALQENLHKLSSTNNIRYVKKGSKYFRPCMKINPSLTKADIIGHGNRKSLIEESNGGLLYLDNFYAFNKKVRDDLIALKENRYNSIDQNYQAVFLAQTPLCPCGKAKIDRPRKCQFSLARCRSVIEKLSVKELSIFQLVIPVKSAVYSTYEQNDLMDLMNERRKKAKELQQKRKQNIPNSLLMVHELKPFISKEVIDFELLPQQVSYERLKAVLSLARTLADLEGNQLIEAWHIEEAKKWALKPAIELSKSF